MCIYPTQLEPQRVIGAELSDPWEWGPEREKDREVAGRDALALLAFNRELLQPLDLLTTAMFRLLKYKMGEGSGDQREASDEDEAEDAGEDPDADGDDEEEDFEDEEN
jgi:hypothetical protein